MTFTFEHVRFIRAIDGDTVIFDIDQGFRTWRLGERFRLSRIDAPEMNQPGGKESQEWLAGLLAAQVIGVRVTGLDKYGRWVAEIETRLFNLNDQMVADGRAVYRSY